MEPNILISIVVPYRNSAYTIAKTMRSILHDAASVCQSIASDRWLQIVCIDNGSTDASCDVIKRVWSEFACLYWVELVNDIESVVGVSNARNRGLELSRGDYVSFVDADDCIMPGYFNLLLTGMAHGVDVVSIASSGQKERRHAIDKYLVCSIEVFVERFLQGWWCWSFVARRPLFDNLSFSGQCYEDVGLFPVVLSRAASILVSCDVVYYYRTSANSLTSQPADWRAAEWDKQFVRLLEQSIQLLPVIRRRLEHEYLHNRMLLRARAGMLPVLTFAQSWSYVQMGDLGINSARKVLLLLQKSLSGAVRKAKQKFLVF
jgi:glycosyltransferase involved in cell wall biosynthesis